jgi:Leucine-rich repeat (LRR) protein
MNIQQAREAIKQAKAENSTELNLSSYQGSGQFDKDKLTSKDLTELLPEIKQLNGLTELYLSVNQISNIEILGQLTNLIVLDLSHNQISDLKVLGQLTILKTLYLSDNRISNIKVLGQLNGLTNCI